MLDEKSWYVMSLLPIPMEDAITHTDENGYECDDPECICHCEQSSQYSIYDELEQTGTHTPNCRCPWCSSEEV